ncbi:hypothetical protein MPER_04230, partial [Moniliophthora perniciosa FA553]
PTFESHAMSRSYANAEWVVRLEGKVVQLGHSKRAVTDINPKKVFLCSA